MDDTPHTSDDVTSNAAYESALEAKRLRRKVLFWRSAAWAVLGIAVVIVLVIYQRGATRCEHSKRALAQYGPAALAIGLGEEPAESFELKWQHLPNELPFYGPGSYIPVIQNWRLKPEEGAALPMAISREPLSLLYKTGRHVLYRTVDGFYVEWVDEEDAAPLLDKVNKQSWNIPVPHSSEHF